MRCYLFNNYQTLVKQFIAITTTKSEDLNMPKYENNGVFDIEEFWIDLISDTKNDFKVLASFMINLMLILNSNCFVASMLSHVSQMKNDIRNSLGVEESHP